MGERTIGVLIEGATGRLGTTQHLRSLMAIRSEGGLLLANGDRLVPEPVLLGRNAARLTALAAANGGLKWSTDRDACLADPDIAIYFDASATGGRPARAAAALDAGKHVYVEKPLAETLADALDLARRAERAGLKNGVVQDKLFLPGLSKLRKLYEADFFGRVLSIRLDFGWWVFDGTLYPAQRPSWNYRKATGGGLILDMFAHWRYIFDRLLGEIKAVSCRHITALPGAATRPASLTRSMSRTRLCDIRTRGRRSGASRLVLGEPGQARRPACRSRSTARSARRCPGCTAASCSRWSRRRSRSSTRNGRRRWSSTSNGRKCRISSQCERLPRRLGAVPPACRRRRAVSVAADRRRQERPARRSLLSEPPRAALDRIAAADIVRQGRPVILAGTSRAI